MKRKAQMTGTPTVQQSVPEYAENGPQKVENLDVNHFVDNDSKYVLNTMDVRERYNSLKEMGKADADAWKESKAPSLPLQEQMRLMREIKGKNPNFYSRAKTIYSRSAKDILSDKYWDFEFTEDDLKVG